MKRTLAILKLPVVAAVAACVLGGTASAQSFPMTGTFTLPDEVRWGRAVLPAGRYTINIASRNSLALVQNTSGRGHAIVLGWSVDNATKARPTSLQIVLRENQRIVQSFNWREGNVLFVYERLTNAERKHLATNEASAMVPIAMAQD